MKDFDIKQKVAALPTQSGVYVMHDCGGNIIYIGKAKNLRRRVSSYFNSSPKNAKVLAMASKVDFFEYYVTPTELDAFVLENSLIKKHTPFYNILLKDGKTYPYIKLFEKEKYPFFKVVRKVENDGAKYFGPFVQKTNPQKILDALSTCFLHRTCTQKSIGDTRHRRRPCLEYDMKRCCAPCCREVDKKEYDLQIEKCLKVLKGDTTELCAVLAQKMKLAADAENFERALELRDMQTYVKNISRSVADLSRPISCDVFACGALDQGLAICVMIVRGGKVFGINCHNITTGIEDCDEALEAFVSAYFEKGFVLCDIAISGSGKTASLLQDYLSQKTGRKVSVSAPQKGDKKKLCDMATANALEFLLNNNSKLSDKSYDGLLMLAKELNLARAPKRIECYDISHIQGTNKVASMVVFENGKKSPKMYRKFKINTVVGNNDFECLKEVLLRRVNEYLKAADPSFCQKPDLVLIDGGKGQLSGVVQEVQNTAFKDVQFASLAKRFEEVFLPGKSMPIMLPRQSHALHILQQIRNESHRFAITFHRNLRTKAMIGATKSTKKRG